jgi:hypothetical protein
VADFTIRIVDRDGTVVRTLDNADFKSATWELNSPGAMSFSVGLYDPDFLTTDVIAKEVQLLRDGAVIWWGVPVTADVTVTQNEKKVDVGCKGLLWYFQRRFIGKADRENLLANPEFETGSLTSWTNTGTATATAATDQRVLGTKAAKLVSGTAQLDNYLTQTITVTGTEIGTLYTLVYWYRIASTGWLGEAVKKRGMTISRVVGGLIQKSSVVEIDGATPRDQWLRAETTIWVPPNATEDLQIRLYSPGGTIWWDAGSLTAMESLFLGDSVDQALIAEAIVEHLQDVTYGKSDLNIATDCPLTGVDRYRVYQHADHHNGFRSLEEFTLLDDGLDFDIELTDTTPGSAVRTFATYYPRKGGTPAVLDFTAADLSELKMSIEGEDACSSITVLGDGDGPDREEGAATDLSVFDGVILEDVISAPPGAAIDSLDARAEEALRVRKVAQIITVTVPAENYVGAVSVGDKGTPAVSEGFCTLSGDWRVHRMTIHANDALEMELNQA